MLLDPKLKQVHYHKVLYKSSETDKIKTKQNTNFLLSFILKTLFKNTKWYKSKYDQKYCKKRFGGISACTLLSGCYENKANHCLQHFISKAALCPWAPQPTAAKLSFFPKMVHHCFSTQPLVMGSAPSLFTYLPTWKQNHRQNVQKTTILYFTTHGNINNGSRKDKVQTEQTTLPYR